ncbi:TetR/AcrR family transcriptional regulator [Kitasatospora sp. NBC_01300]|uniref:TetR/AcrR family transcriptional regulator n=1 Tax=Kitasatospora sp. NBC_01300 TaxID=2903574 RepID=UPI002F9155B4|nr:TetR/AcrR family transcriptional regulator [Kitasatospora sp. NBC_01300]
MSSEVSTGAGRKPRGRIERRQAILDGAFMVFARRGYAQACVQEIAQEAGVAKPTVYNHLTDKEALFREAVLAAADRLSEAGLAAVEGLRGLPADGDPRPALVGAGHALLEVHGSEGAGAVRRLASAQAAQFPDVAVGVRERTALRVRAALADRLARLALTGRLRPCDPEQAAEHLLALLTGPLDYRSDTPAPDLRALAESAVDVFLRAYGGDPAR